MSDKYLTLIKESERLIYKIASKYSMYYSIDDLYQVGSIGVIKAYKNFKKDGKNHEKDNRKKGITEHYGN